MFLKDNPNFKSRGAKDTPSFVGSLSPLRNFRGFATQVVGTNVIGSAAKLASSALSGDRASAGVLAFGVVLAAGEALNQSGVGQFLVDAAIDPLGTAYDLTSGER